MKKILLLAVMLSGLALAQNSQEKPIAKQFPAQITACQYEEFAQQVADNEEGIEIYFMTGFCSRECMTVRGESVYNGTTGQVYNISWNGRQVWAITGGI